MTKKQKYIIGAICGILAAMCYGTNPLGAMKLYQDGISPAMVLSYRFGLAALILFLILPFTRARILPNRKEFWITLLLGVLFAASSLTLYCSFKRMPAGVASTLLFIYPVLTSLIMTGCYREKLRWSTILSLFLSIGGIGVLSLGGEEIRLDGIGILLVMISALTYAVYIVTVNRAQLNFPLFSMTAWILLFCFSCIFAFAAWQKGFSSLQLPQNAIQWGYAVFLAIVPALLSLSLTTVSSLNIGSTPTAILGALEPLTAVCIGIWILQEPFTWRLVAGIVLILSAVLLVLISGNKKQSA